MIEEGSPEDIINRLRGIITIPVNDGAGLLNGKDTFTRNYGPMGAINETAALMIERLVAGEAVEWGEVNTLILELQQPDDPLGTGRKYVVPIRHKASWLIHDLRQKLES